MFANPLIQRYRFSQFRPQLVWTFSALYVCVALLILFVNSLVRKTGESAETVRVLSNALFIQFGVIQVLLCCIVLPFHSANVVPREIADKSYDFFRLLPLTAWQKMLGVLIGRNLLGWTFAIINLGLCLLCAMSSDISRGTIFKLLLLLLSVTLLFNGSGLLLSLLNLRRGKPASNLVLVIAIPFALMWIGGALFRMVEDMDLNKTAAYFFAWKVPLLYLISGYVLVGAAWVFAGILRRLTNEYEPLFSRAGAAGFMFCYLALIYGLFYHTLACQPRPADSLEVFYMVSMLPLLIIALLSLHSVDKYLEITRAAAHGRGLSGRVALHSNLCLGIMLLAIWAAGIGVVYVIAGADLSNLAWCTAQFISAFLVLFALLELYTLYVVKNDKVGFLLGFVAVLYMFLPLILAGMFDYEQLKLFSPLGRFFDLKEIVKPGQAVLTLGLDGVLLLLPAFLIIRNFRAIAEIRTLLEQIARSERTAQRK